MKKCDLKVIYLDLNKLTLFPANSKIHTKEQIQHIANSIQKFGFNDPLGIAGEDNCVLEGNGRLEALKLLGYTQAPCIRLDHLNKEEQNAYVIAHNATNLETGFDEAVLFNELEKLQNFDFKDFGLDSGKFLQTLDQLQKKELKSFHIIHYLISLDINFNDRIIELINKIKAVQGVEVESTLN